jgi:2-(1,2-epoxy-1,2-dihydrophenyl)acetyl-CoA isomerase
MTYAHIQFDVQHHIATLTLNRPEAKNALDVRTRDEISDVIRRLREGEDARDLGVRALILRSSSDTFSAGGDIKAMTKVRSPVAIRHRLLTAHEWYDALLGLEIPVISVVRGPAYGAGLSLALAADFVLASPSASFCAVFARMGLIPDLGLLYLLPRLIGLQRAKEMIFSTRIYEADEARAIGLVLDVVPDADIDAAALTLAQRLAAAPPMALGLAKVLLNRSLETDLRTMAELEAMAQGAAVNTPEHRDAVERFLAKQALPYPGFSRADWMRKP